MRGGESHHAPSDCSLHADFQRAFRTPPEAPDRRAATGTGRATWVAGGGCSGCGPPMELLRVEPRQAVPGEECAAATPAQRGEAALGHPDGQSGCGRGSHQVQIHAAHVPNGSLRQRSIAFYGKSESSERGGNPVLSGSHDASGQLGTQGDRYAPPPGARTSPTPGAGGGEGLSGRALHGVAGASADRSPSRRHGSCPGGHTEEAAPLSVVLQLSASLPLPPILLQNPHQICYINACAQALNWVCLMTGVPRHCGGKACFALQLLNKTGKLCVLHSLAWRVS